MHLMTKQLAKATAIVAFLLFSIGFVEAATDPFSKPRLIQFYNEFIIEERDILSGSGINPSPYVPPPTPDAPVFKTGLLPILFVNNSGYPDSQVYIVITGKNYDSPALQVWGSVNTTPGSNFGVVTLDPVNTSQNSTQFSYLLSSLPQSSSGRVVYLPQTQSGIIWFSIQKPLSMTVEDDGGTNSIVQPNFMSTSDSNYYTNFDIFEFTRDNTNQVFADATAVSFFSIPLYGYLSGATSQSSNTGLYHPRAYVMSKAASVINSYSLQAATKQQWMNLFLKDADQNILRFASTGKSISASLFDNNYLDDSASYGYSYIQNLWTGGPSSYYVANPLLMSVGVTSPSTATYSYSGSVDNTTKLFTFTSSNGGPTVTFLAPTAGTGVTTTTSYYIFSALNLTNPVTQPTAGTAADAVSKLFEEAVIAGILPVPVGQTLSLTSLTGSQSSYYTINSNLASGGQTTGPWYDLYSKALHSLGSIYTYGFDDALWPQVLLKAPFTDNSTYLSITIGNAQLQ